MRQRHGRKKKVWGIARLLSYAVLCSAAGADPLTLSLSGSLTSSTVNGVSVGAGNYTTDQLSTVAQAVGGTVTANGFTGVSLWGLLGGNAGGTSSDVITDAGKNAILRSYLLATNSSGSQFVISLGEVDPFFGASAKAPFIAYAGGNGSPALIFPEGAATGRNIENITSLQALGIPAPATGSGGPSTSFVLSGNVSHPGIYIAAELQNLPSATETVNGDTYTGVALWSLLGANTTNEFNQYVLAEGTDGYEVLFSLAELDPSLGAPLDLVPYADTSGQFPANGVARVVIPGDNHAGRYVSNLSLLEVTSIPEPSTMGLWGISLLGGLVLYRSGKRIRSC